jgi:uncharacterized membrane protein YqhA
MFQNIERFIAATLRASRWLMAPLYLGLIAALGIVLVEFCRELAHTIAGFGGIDRHGEPRRAEAD